MNLFEAERIAATVVQIIDGSTQEPSSDLLLFVDGGEVTIRSVSIALQLGQPEYGPDQRWWHCRAEFPVQNRRMSFMRPGLFREPDQAPGSKGMVKA